MRIKEKEGAEGTLWLELWEAYIKATKSLWGKFPEILIGGFALLFPYYRIFELKFRIKASIHSIWGITQFIFHPKKFDFKLSPCDVLLFYSSTKLNIMGSIVPLAIRLTRLGYRCVVLSGSNMRICRKDISSPLGVSVINEDGYCDWWVYGSEWLSSLKILCRALLITIILYVQIMWKHPRDVGLMLYEPFEVLNRLLGACHRLKVADKLLKQLKPRLIVTMHERLPIISEILLSKESSNAYKILYHHENPTIDTSPVISQEVCVWNQTMMDEIIEFLDKDRLPTFTIVGNQEINQIYKESLVAKSSIELEEYQNQIGDKPIFLYLSQYAQLGPGLTEGPREAIAWIEYAAIHCPDWHFIVKRRAFHYNLFDPGSKALSKYENVTIPTEGVNFGQFLRCPNVVVVASIYSMGLYVAAGVGIKAFRFLVPHCKVRHLVLDDISTPVHSAKELVRLLNNFKDDRISIKEYIKKEDSRFPYRGQTLDKMENLCLQHLKEIL